MQINIPSGDHERLTQLALAAGYQDVEGYVTEHVLAIARQPAAEEFAPLSPADLAASLAMCDQGMAEMEAGASLSLEEARGRTFARLRRKGQ